MILLVSNVLLNAQAPPPPTGGGGGTTPEGASAPIDMYVYILAIAAILFIVLYANKIKKKQIV